MTIDSLRQCWVALRTLVVLTVVCGVAYPLTIWAVGDVAFRHQAAGSLVQSDGAAVGSRLIGQQSNGVRWFHGRPSVGEDNPLATGASNLGASNRLLLSQIARRKADVATTEHVAPADVPPDAVTASGSGVDPDISPAYASIQVPRVARANHLTQHTVRLLVDKATSGRSLGFLGEPSVNVLALNVSIRQAHTR